ncbi:ATP-grasp domain-containing protein [Paenibacillus sp. NPDC058910]|uniref:ATP-grasp domain-containing protein n=1 Tax=unclassified Paenibacillus TaxID=185978 RepID=UPI0036846927
MMEFNILFTSAGRRVSLIRYFKEALLELGIEGLMVTADMRRNAPAAWVSDAHEILPRVTDLDYIPRLMDICEKHAIKLVIPLIDTELQVLADHRFEFEKIGAFVLVSAPEVIQIGNDKRKTALFLESIGIKTPKLMDPYEVLQETDTCYPLMLKPFNGSSSMGVNKVNSVEELKFFMNNIPNPILQEFVIGQEYTVDVLMDFQGKACAAVPRLRIETRSGEVSKGMTVKDIQIMTAAKKVAEALPGAVGCITLQCFVTDLKEIVFIEINPRFGGGVPLSLAAGAHYCKTIIQWLLNRPVDWNDMDGWRDGLVMLRYDEAFFVQQGDIK